ncbi:MAG: response regulator [Kordiimonadaceae bacterium]|nr:response regulator [Kordiimonadaceae bacterium]
MKNSETAGEKDDLVVENNQVLSALLEEAIQPLPLDEVLGNCLDILLTLSWLSLLPKAGIFLTRQNPFGEEELELVAERNLGEPIKTLCSKVAFGHCLCGRAAMSKKSVHASCVDERHDITFDGIKPHGHYNIPILSRGRAVGVLVFYLPHGTEKYDEGVRFLERVADTLALVITLNLQAAELSEKVTELDYQKLALDEHAIVSITDVKGNMTYANDKFCFISGFPLEELIGSNHRLLKSDEHSLEFYKELWGTISKGRVWHGEIKNRQKLGGYYWVAATIVPFLNSKGKPFQYVAIRTDITAEKQKELELRKASEIADSANQAKSEFLATMSHEIRTPMTGVMGFADLLLEDGLDENSREKVYRIKESTRALLRIINDILDMSKLDAGKVEIEYLDFHLPALISDVLALFSEKRGDKRAKLLNLITELSDNFPTTVNSDPTRLRQVLINLVGNAMKFTESGSVTIRVKLIEADTSAPKLHFAIEDTGIGIKSDVLDDLFSEFTQADASITRRFEGTGLGLSICKKLVTLMDGEIGVESIYRKGSTFWFTLPYIVAMSEIEEPGTKTKDVFHYTAKRSLNILVVDDNGLNQQIITAIIGGFGHTYDIADHGMQAVEMHKLGDYDLILMDIRMPVMSGPDATRLIRQMDGEKNSIPIIALTADAMDEHKKGYLEAGMNDVATKPIERSALAIVMNEVLGEEINVPSTTSEEEKIIALSVDPAKEQETQRAVDDFLKQIGADADD